MSSFSGTDRSTNSIAWKRWLLWNKRTLQWKRRWWGYNLVGCCKLSLLANESCDDNTVYFQRWLKWRAMFIPFLASGNDVISLELIFVFPVSCRTNRLLISYEISKQARVAAFLRAFLFVSFFFPVCAPKEESWSKAFLAETVETGDKYRDTTYNIFIRCRVFSERVGPRILLLESVDYFGTSEYFSGRKKKNLYEQTSAKLCRWWG